MPRRSRGNQVLSRGACRAGAVAEEPLVARVRLEFQTLVARCRGEAAEIWSCRAGTCRAGAARAQDPMAPSPAGKKLVPVPDRHP